MANDDRPRQGHRAPCEHEWRVTRRGKGEYCRRCGLQRKYEPKAPARRQPAPAPPADALPTVASPAEALPIVASPAESAPTAAAPAEDQPAEAPPTEAPTEAASEGSVEEPRLGAWPPPPAAPWVFADIPVEEGDLAPDAETATAASPAGPEPEARSAAAAGAMAAAIVAQPEGASGARGLDAPQVASESATLTEPEPEARSATLAERAPAAEPSPTSDEALAWPAEDGVDVAAIIAPPPSPLLVPPPGSSSKVVPRITRPAPMPATARTGAMAMSAGVEAMPAGRSRRTIVRTGLAIAILVFLGILVGLTVADIGRGARGGASLAATPPTDPTATSEDRSPPGSSTEPTALVTTAPASAPSAAVVGPEVAPPAVGLGERLTARGIQLALAWQPPAEGGRPDGYELEVSRDGVTFEPVELRGPRARDATFPAAAGREYVIRVRARGADGTSGPFAESSAALAAIEESSPVIRTTGAWDIAQHADYTGGGAIFSSRAGARLALPFEGTGVAIVGPTGPGRGQADVIIDGELVGRLDAGGTTFRPVTLLFTADGLEAGPHILTVRVVGTSGRPRVALDRFLVLSQG